MKITPEQFERIKHAFPVQRGNVSIDNLQLLNAILYVAEHGCKWRGLPKEFGNWHTVYTRMKRWNEAGVLTTVFEQLQKEQMMDVQINVVSLDSTIIKVHSDGCGARKKTVGKLLVNPEGGGLPKFTWLLQVTESQ